MFSLKIKLSDLFLPLVVLAFVGLSVTFLTSIFNMTSRWFILAAFALYLLSRNQLLKVFKYGATLVALLYCIWGITTSLWSEQVTLSFYKSLAALFVTVCTLAGGYLWSKEHSIEKVLDLLLPLTLVALAAGVLGRFSSDAYLNTGGGVLYQGLVNGSNMFGSMLAMCSPLLVWKVRQYWSTKWRWLWVLAALTGSYYLFAASSRGAMLVVLCTITSYLRVMPLAKKMQFIILAVISAILLFLFLPNAYENFERKYIYKQSLDSSSNRGVLYTRADVWSVSWQQAVKGGVFGGGYGVTIGSKRKYRGGLNSLGYGREKGNSQMAILEEVGIVGFLGYVVLLVTFLGKLLANLLSWPASKERQVLALVFGSCCGMLVQSVFEAWWVAPGSPEYVYFWVMTGVGLGLLTHKPVPIKRNASMSLEKNGKEQVWTSEHGTYPSP